MNNLSELTAWALLPPGTPGPLDWLARAGLPQAAHGRSRCSGIHMCSAHQKPQRPTPRGLSRPQIGHLELEGKTKLSELWDAQFSSVASGGGQEGYPGGIGMWRMLRSSCEFCNYSKAQHRAGTGWACPEHPMPLMQLGVLPLGPSTPLSPQACIPFLPGPAKPGQGCGGGAVAHPSNSAPATPLSGSSSSCFPSKAGAEIVLGLQHPSPGDLSPESIKPFQFTHMPH